MAKQKRWGHRTIPHLDGSVVVYGGKEIFDLRGLTTDRLISLFGNPRAGGELQGFGIYEWYHPIGIFGARFMTERRLVLNVKFRFRPPLPTRRVVERLLFPDGNYEIYEHGEGTFLDNRERGVMTWLDDMQKTHICGVGFSTPHMQHAQDVCTCPGHETVRIPRA